MSNNNPFQQYDPSEPIFWTSTVPGYNTPDRERWIIGADGKRVKEKIPQRAHVGDHFNRRLAPNADGRWILVVRHDGHLIRMIMTNAAAHTDTATPWAQDRRQKARHFGWYHPGACPCALVASGELAPETIVDDEVRTAQPCKPGTYSLKDRCPHSLAEQRARRAAHDLVQTEREVKFKSKEDKVLDAMREQNDAIREQNATVAHAVMSLSASQPKSSKPPKGE